MQTLWKFFLLVAVASSVHADERPAGDSDYWTKAGQFNAQHTSMNYQRSARFLSGGDYWEIDNPTTPQKDYATIFDEMPAYVYDADPHADPIGGDHSGRLYYLPPTPADVNDPLEVRYRVREQAGVEKVQVKMSTFYLSTGNFDNGTAGWNDQYDKDQSYAAQSVATGYAKTAAPTINNLIWLTPFGHLKDYMNAGGPADGQWSDDTATLSNYLPGADPNSKNFTSGKNPYNRAAAALGMLNGSFEAEQKQHANDQLGFGNFYRVADIWVNAEDVARTDVDSSWTDTEIRTPEDPFSPNLNGGHPNLSDAQIDAYGYWGPVGTKHEGEQQLWHDAMENPVVSYGPIDGAHAEVSFAVRGGAYEYTVEVDWPPAFELDLKYWSSNNAYHPANAFYALWWEQNTKRGLFPWTGHGFTYDWYYGFSDAHYEAMYQHPEILSNWNANSFSEFIVRPGAEFEVVQTKELVEYLTGSPAMYQPTSIPEPRAFLLVLLGLTLLPGRRTRRWLKKSQRSDSNR